MDIAGLEERILEIKDKVIENVDLHFNEYVSDDLQEIGEDEYFLIDSVSYSIYWTERLNHPVGAFFCHSVVTEDLSHL